MRKIRELEFVACRELTPNSKMEEYRKDPNLFIYYCADSDLTYILKEAE